MHLSRRTARTATAVLTTGGLLTAGITAASAVEDPPPPGVDVVAANCGAAGSHWMAMRFTADATAMRLVSNDNPGQLGARLVSYPGYEQGPGRTLLMTAAADLRTPVTVVLEVTTGDGRSAQVPVKFSTGLRQMAGDFGIDFMVGSDASNTLAGGPDEDVLCGGNGHDVLAGGPGDDLIFGGAGNDFLFSGEGADVAFGEAGHDGIHGEEGDDFLFGGPVGSGTGDNDSINGGPGQDVVAAVYGGDKVYGGEDADSIAVAGGARVLDRESGDRVVVTPVP
ncbi:hypothetical protein GCM10010124_16160 [Pilimelia terevasa]|uniref:Uncharacterized protein n=1 Tax=Pilimelia terevasa TaxID=53372 RepID=A0A8J3BIW2_9ACTN|nr:calcium-binding protein [Pilimelia terevasa]GGK24404.1 hypothetical protein GCM10010124_16160 [Pilimelia terevasa]